MAAAADGFGDQRADVDAEAGNHPRRAGRFILQQGTVRGERISLGREAVGEGLGEHQPVDRRLGAHRARQRRARAGEAGLVDRIRGVEAVADRKGQGMANVRFGIEIGRRRRRVAADGELGEIDAAGIDGGELQKAARRKSLDVREASGGFVRQRADPDAGRGKRGIHRHIDLGADALDDACVDLPVEGLRSAPIVGMHVNDAGAGGGAVDALGHNRVDGVGNSGLAAPAPRTVQRCLDPDLVHRPHTP